MTQNVPDISVLVSTWNDRRHVARKLAELRAQTAFARAEVIFLETASPQRERELLAPFCATHPNCRLLATEARLTLYQAWNLGWQAARAPLLCYSNMDDAMHPRLLERVIGTLQRRRLDACTVLTARQAPEDDLTDFSPARLRRLPLILRPGPFSAWRADLAARVGMFDEAYTIAGDREFWSRLGAARVRVGVVPEVLYLYTADPASLAHAGGERRRQEKRRMAAAHPRAGWPARLKWQLRAARLWRALAPSRAHPAP